MYALFPRLKERRTQTAGTLSGPRAPSFTTTITFPTPTLQQFQSQVRTDVQSILSRSSALTSAGNIQAFMDGNTLVLRGSVSSEQERRLAEAMARLTPGVFTLRNDLRVPNQPPPP